MSKNHLPMILGFALAASPMIVLNRDIEDDWEKVQWRFDVEQPLQLEIAERSVTAEQVPAAALRALRQAAAQHESLEFEEEKRGGETYYEGEWDTATGEAEATVTADGVTLETEREVAVDQVPAAVRRLAKQMAGDAKVSFGQRQFIFYEIQFEQDGKSREILVSPDGRKIGTEISSESEAAD